MGITRRGKSVRGFTLMEVIIVLIILALIAAILIPSLVGWIKKAAMKSEIVNARVCVLAAQTIASESYGVEKKDLEGDATAAQIKTVAKLSETEGTVDSASFKNSKVHKLIYISSDKKYIVTYYDGSYTVTEASKLKYLSELVDYSGKQASYSQVQENLGIMASVFSQYIENTLPNGAKITDNNPVDIAAGKRIAYVAGGKGGYLDCSGFLTAFEEQMGSAKSFIVKIDKSGNTAFAIKGICADKLAGKNNISTKYLCYDTKNKKWEMQTSL